MSEISRATGSPFQASRSRSPVSRIPKDERSYSQMHLGHFHSRSHDKTGNRHWRRGGQCFPCSESERLRQRREVPNYSSVSANRLFRQLVFEEINLIRLFTRLARNSPDLRRALFVVRSYIDIHRSEWNFDAFWRTELAPKLQGVSDNFVVQMERVDWKGAIWGAGQMEDQGDAEGGAGGRQEGVRGEVVQLLKYLEANMYFNLQKIGHGKLQKSLPKALQKTYEFSDRDGSRSREHSLENRPSDNQAGQSKSIGTENRFSIEGTEVGSLGGHKQSAGFPVVAKAQTKPREVVIKGPFKALKEQGQEGVMTSKQSAPARYAHVESRYRNSQLPDPEAKETPKQSLGKNSTERGGGTGDPSPKNSFPGPERESRATLDKQVDKIKRMSTAHGRKFSPSGALMEGESGEARRSGLRMSKPESKRTITKQFSDAESDVSGSKTPRSKSRDPKDSTHKASTADQGTSNTRPSATSQPQKNTASSGQTGRPSAGSRPKQSLASRGRGTAASIQVDFESEEERSRSRSKGIQTPSESNSRSPGRFSKGNQTAELIVIRESSGAKSGSKFRDSDAGRGSVPKGDPRRSSTGSWGVLEGPDEGPAVHPHPSQPSYPEERDSVPHPTLQESQMSLRMGKSIQLGQLGDSRRVSDGSAPKDLLNHQPESDGPGRVPHGYASGRSLKNSLAPEVMASIVGPNDPKASANNSLERQSGLESSGMRSPLEKELRSFHKESRTSEGIRHPTQGSEKRTGLLPSNPPSELYLNQSRQSGYQATYPHKASDGHQKDSLGGLPPRKPTDGGAAGSSNRVQSPSGSLVRQSLEKTGKGGLLEPAGKASHKSHKDEDPRDTRQTGLQSPSGLAGQRETAPTGRPTADVRPGSLGQSHPPRDTESRDKNNSQVSLDGSKRRFKNTSVSLHVADFRSDSRSASPEPVQATPRSTSLPTRGVEHESRPPSLVELKPVNRSVSPQLQRSYQKLAHENSDGILAKLTRKIAKVTFADQIGKVSATGLPQTEADKASFRPISFHHPPPNSVAKDGHQDGDKYAMEDPERVKQEMSKQVRSNTRRLLAHAVKHLRVQSPAKLSDVGSHQEIQRTHKGSSEVDRILAKMSAEDVGASKNTNESKSPPASPKFTSNGSYGHGQTLGSLKVSAADFNPTIQAVEAFAPERNSRKGTWDSSFHQTDQLQTPDAHPDSHTHSQDTTLAHSAQTTHKRTFQETRKNLSQNHSVSLSISDQKLSSQDETHKVSINPKASATTATQTDRFKKERHADPDYRLRDSKMVSASYVVDTGVHTELNSIGESHVDGYPSSQSRDGSSPLQLPGHIHAGAKATSQVGPNPMSMDKLTTIVDKNSNSVDEYVADARINTQPNSLGSSIQDSKFALLHSTQSPKAGGVPPSKFDSQQPGRQGLPTAASNGLSTSNVIYSEHTDALSIPSLHKDSSKTHKYPQADKLLSREELPDQDSPMGRRQQAVRNQATSLDQRMQAEAAAARPLQAKDNKEVLRQDTRHDSLEGLQPVQMVPGGSVPYQPQNMFLKDSDMSAPSEHVSIRQPEQSFHPTSDRLQHMPTDPFPQSTVPDVHKSPTTTNSPHSGLPLYSIDASSASEHPAVRSHDPTRPYTSNRSGTSREDLATQTDPVTRKPRAQLQPTDVHLVVRDSGADLLSQYRQLNTHLNSLSSLPRNPPEPLSSMSDTFGLQERSGVFGDSALRSLHTPSPKNLDLGSSQFKGGQSSSGPAQKHSGLVPSQHEAFGHQSFAKGKPLETYDSENTPSKLPQPVGSAPHVPPSDFRTSRDVTDFALQHVQVATHQNSLFASHPQGLAAPKKESYVAPDEQKSRWMASNSDSDGKPQTEGQVSQRNSLAPATGQPPAHKKNIFEASEIMPSEEVITITRSALLARGMAVRESDKTAENDLAFRNESFSKSEVIGSLDRNTAVSFGANSVGRGTHTHQNSSKAVARVISEVKVTGLTKMTEPQPEAETPVPAEPAKATNSFRKTSILFSNPNKLHAFRENKLAKTEEWLSRGKLVENMTTVYLWTPAQPGEINWQPPI